MKKCAIVTGGSSGIGESIAITLRKEGYFVVVADKNEEMGISLSRKIGSSFIKIDLSERKSYQKLVDFSIQEYGSIDILVNNAGFQHIAPLEEFPEATWDQMLSVMLTAPFVLTKYVWPYMKKNKWGRIINISSIHGMIASANKVGYITAKHGLIGLTRSAAIEGGKHGITANALCPSYVRTPLVQEQISDQAKTHNIHENEVTENIFLRSAVIKKIIEPDEVANVVKFLCSDDARSITGANWTIDAGWTAQ